MSAAPKRREDAVGSLFDFEEIELTQSMYEKFAKKMYDLAGVDLPYSPKNHALIRNRIIKVLRRHKFESYEQYWAYLQSPTPESTSEFISALTTNMTSFYRESTHFDFLTQKLPELLKGQPEVRIWCAAASTGQEPYTIAVTVCEALGEELSRKVRILATDVDHQVLKKGSVGVYDEKEMQGLSPVLRQKYFQKAKKDEENYYRANDKIHKMLRFAPFNLMSPKYEFQNKFHVIFCRNVLIYFDEPTTKKVIDNLTSCLLPGGYLILGHSESGNVKHSQLKPLSRAVYQKV